MDKLDQILNENFPSDLPDEDRFGKHTVKTMEDGEIGLIRLTNLITVKDESRMAIFAGLSSVIQPIPQIHQTPLYYCHIKRTGDSYYLDESEVAKRIRSPHMTGHYKNIEELRMNWPSERRIQLQIAKNIKPHTDGLEESINDLPDEDKFGDALLKNMEDGEVGLIRATSLTTTNDGPGMAIFAHLGETVYQPDPDVGVHEYLYCIKRAGNSYYLDETEVAISSGMAQTRRMHYDSVGAFKRSFSHRHNPNHWVQLKVAKNIKPQTDELEESINDLPDEDRFGPPHALVNTIPTDLSYWVMPTAFFLRDGNLRISAYASAENVCRDDDVEIRRLEEYEITVSATDYAKLIKGPPESIGQELRYHSSSWPVVVAR